MEAKEKAKDLQEQFAQIQREFKQANYYGQAKKSAQLCVKNILTELNKLPSKDLSDLQYWTEVEYELSLL
jgi:geranylgeranyl pyrophosphate synthase